MIAAANGVQRDIGTVRFFANERPMFKWLERLMGIDDLFGPAEEAVTEPVPDRPPSIGQCFHKDTHEALPYSISLTGAFYRWHSQRYFWGGPEFWRTFQDGPWKWDAQQRYAGRGCNCGHFFGLTKSGATAEADFYGARGASTDTKRLTVIMRLDRVLNLTTVDGMRHAFDAVTENADFSDPFIAEESIETIKGGSIVTDRIGHWACRAGYQAALVLGARAIYGPDTVAPVPGLLPRRPWDPDRFAYYLEAYRQQGDELNLIVFRSRYLLSRCWKFGFTYDSMEKNEFFEKPEDEIETSLQMRTDYAKYGEDYQEERRRTVYMDKITYHERQ